MTRKDRFTIKEIETIVDSFVWNQIFKDREDARKSDKNEIEYWAARRRDGMKLEDILKEFHQANGHGYPPPMEFAYAGYLLGDGGIERTHRRTRRQT